jgi:uncharacterized protein YdeI (YjbR/CyaY-like superfamily)
MKKPSKDRLTIPRDLAAALGPAPAAERLFRALPPSHQREYVKWIVEAKKPQTRQRRAAEAPTLLLKRHTAKQKD